MFALMEEDLFGSESHAAYDPLMMGLHHRCGGSMANQALDPKTREHFVGELERLLALPAGSGANLDEVRAKRDALRRQARTLLGEAQGFESKRDDMLAAMKQKTATCKQLQADGDSQRAAQVKAAMHADYALGAVFDQKAGELMDRYFELMALESEVSSYFSVLDQSDD